MKILYLDCFSGISGDMLLGAFVALGVPPEKLETAFRTLPIPPVRVSTRQILKQGIAARSVSFLFDEAKSGARTYVDIRKLIEASGLEDRIKRESLKTFEALATAESKIHGIEKEKVHFHEVGGIDTICDVVGTMVARDALSVDRVYTSPVPLGRGEIVCAHGKLPNPAPATLELLKGFETVQLPYTMEFVTPTGAAILRSWIEPEEPVPSYRPLRVGYGAGDREVEGRPNVLRAIIGETAEGISGDRVVVLETDIDDETAEVLAHVFRGLFEKGALDVTSHSIMMKKGRIGTRISVVSPFERQEALADYLFRETTTLGVRILPVFRKVLRREIDVISTSLGEVTVKITEHGNGERRLSPEYEACARLAKIHHLPLRKVIDLVKREAEKQLLPVDDE